MRVEQVMIKETASLVLPPKHLAHKQTKQQLKTIEQQTYPRYRNHLDTQTNQ